MKNFKNYKLYKNGLVIGPRGKALAHHLNACGYVTVNLCVNGTNRSQLLHRLLAIEFIPNPENKPTVNHKNGVRSDNRLENLGWATLSEQQRHSARVLKTPRPRGEDHHASKLTSFDIQVIKEELRRGKSCAKIAREYDVTPQAINSVKKGRTWLNS